MQNQDTSVLYLRVAGGKRVQGRREEKTMGSAYAATALQTVGVKFLCINLPAEPRLVLDTNYNPVTSGMSGCLRDC